MTYSKKRDLFIFFSSSTFFENFKRERKLVVGFFCPPPSPPRQTSIQKKVACLACLSNLSIRSLAKLFCKKRFSARFALYFSKCQKITEPLSLSCLEVSFVKDSRAVNYNITRSAVLREYEVPRRLIVNGLIGL